MKKITAVVIAASMLLLFTACGKTETVSSAKPADDSAPVSSAVSSDVTSSDEVSSDTSSEPLEDEVGSTPEYEDIYDSEKVEIVGNDVVKTSVAGDITQIMRFSFNNEKTAVVRVRLEFYSKTEVDFAQEEELYKELGYKIVEIDKSHLIMDAADESVEAWASQATTMEGLADLLK